MKKVNCLAEELDVNSENVGNAAELYAVAVKSADAWTLGKPLTKLGKPELREVVENSL